MTPHSVHRYLMLALLVLAFLPLPVPGATVSSSEGISGTIYSSHYHRPIDGAFVILERGIYKQVYLTGQDGHYAFNPPPGHGYNLTIVYMGETVDTLTNITISSSTGKVYDVVLDIKLDETVQMKGVVMLDGSPARGLKVNVTGIGNPYWNSTLTDDYGYYEIMLPEGEFNVTLENDRGEVLHAESITVTGNLTSYRLNMDVESKEGIKILTYSEIIQILTESWYVILALVVFVIVMLLMYGRLADFLLHMEAKEIHYLNDVAKRLLSRVIKFAYFYIMFYVLLWSSINIVPVVDRTTASYFLGWLQVFVQLFILFVFARITLIVKDNTIEFLKLKSDTDKSKMTASMIMLLDIILKYSIIAFFSFLAIILVLVQLGMYDAIASLIVGFFVRNVGYLTFILILILLAYGISKFVGSFMEDLKTRDTRLSKSMVETLGKGTTFTINALIALIIVFTLLSMAGMSEIASTIMIILSTMIGLVVAMAATGSIGNILSGLVLQSMKPFDVGDRVKVGDGIVGDIIEVNLMFTRVRTLRSEYLDIPNNLIMANTIINYSRSGSVAIEISLSIGYDVPVEKVISLLKQGARDTPGVLKEPKPQALAVDFMDYAVKYILRVYTDKPKALPALRSSLIKNVHNRFYSSGVEILSPWYLVRREDSIPAKDELIEKYRKSLSDEEDSSIPDENITAGLSMMENIGNSE